MNTKPKKASSSCEKATNANSAIKGNHRRKITRARLVVGAQHGFTKGWQQAL